ncbi:Rrf2 family transcriptional regulator [Nitrincola sp. A-D6]|uniref:Rrf2 family transcriptional regulator n=1 Tax=Nitrincola sp. A-D6 TaxID=1545442 RepID=UPI00051FA13A|nr:Rrf2 family transcriptional regulator [Nitrincola sp. A-D6]KGK41678.1 Rrf2 family transcriptional regulator [Nitrincola sp. A-D6]
MHITSFTDYALRVLIYAATKAPEQCTIAEIAACYNISRNHLMKVVQTLNQRGYLCAQRGKNGGLRLKGPANEINLGQLIREIEQDKPLVECFSYDNQCLITPACQLKGILAEAQQAFYQSLDRYTLADLVTARSQPQLMQLLNLA